MTADDVRTAVAGTASGSISVRATEFGLPVEVHIDQSELRYGGAALAETILALCARAGAEATLRRRHDDTHALPAFVLGRVRPDPTSSRAPERGPWTARA